MVIHPTTDRSDNWPSVCLFVDPAHGGEMRIFSDMLDTPTVEGVAELSPHYYRSECGFYVYGMHERQFVEAVKRLGWHLYYHGPESWIA